MSVLFSFVSEDGLLRHLHVSRGTIEQELSSDSFVHSTKLSLSPYETFHLVPGVSNPPDCTQNQYPFEASKRIGLIGRKIGMTLQWFKDGTRCLCTLSSMCPSIMSFPPMTPRRGIGTV
ncbi:hypothetical protein niasHT_031760 [Heterodera trifolii]|uniref:Uncharacterized protein n=1 Tax=Heterodera trifolii TaxID=157864 RepID=A0ABD2IJL0_9BILA